MSHGASKWLISLVLFVAVASMFLGVGAFCSWTQVVDGAGAVAGESTLRLVGIVILGVGSSFSLIVGFVWWPSVRPSDCLDMFSRELAVLSNGMLFAFLIGIASFFVVASVDARGTLAALQVATVIVSFLSVAYLRLFPSPSRPILFPCAEKTPEDVRGYLRLFQMQKVLIGRHQRAIAREIHNLGQPSDVSPILAAGKVSPEIQRRVEHAYISLIGGTCGQFQDSVATLLAEIDAVTAEFNTHQGNKTCPLK
ncbi:hypothetical protein OAG62_00030 [bacterium]|nr:hypothetical protein [bacterium]